MRYRMCRACTQAGRDGAHRLAVGTKAGCTNVCPLLDCVVNHIAGNDSVCGVCG